MKTQINLTILPKTRSDNIKKQRLYACFLKILAKKSKTGSEI